MHRIAVELPIMTVTAALMASLVLIAGTVMEASTEPIAPSLTLRPGLCTVSYCEPPELVLTANARSESPGEAADDMPGED